MILTVHANERSAESWRRSWSNRSFESEGEWYLQSSEPRGLPQSLADMPGSLVFHTFIWGEAADEDAMLVGAFRREHIGCVFRIRDEHLDETIALAEWFAGCPVPDQWELAWSDAQLRGFIPTTATLGLPVDPDDTSWF